MTVFVAMHNSSLMLFFFFPLNRSWKVITNTKSLLDSNSQGRNYSTQRMGGFCSVKHYSLLIHFRLVCRWDSEAVWEPCLKTQEELQDLVQPPQPQGTLHSGEVFRGHSARQQVFWRNSCNTARYYYRSRTGPVSFQFHLVLPGLFFFSKIEQWKQKQKEEANQERCSPQEGVGAGSHTDHTEADQPDDEEEQAGGYKSAVGDQRGCRCL